MTTARLKPIYLLADSHLLFWREGGRLFLDSVRAELESESPGAAYIGASNGDDPAFYGIFKEAMQSIGIGNCRMINSSPTEEEAAFMSDAEMILLAGGEVEKGWRVFEQNGMKERVINRYYEGALLMGVSAGAVQLGLYGGPTLDRSPNELMDTFKLVPFIIGAHEEQQDWEQLKKALRLAGHSIEGIGLPTGGGAIYRADYSIEPVRKPVHIFRRNADEITQSLLFPSSDCQVLETSGKVC